MATVTKARARKRTTKSRRTKKSRVKKLSRTKQPTDMTLVAWQIELRRQYGSEQDFKLKNLGDEPFYSEFEVSNSKNGRVYRVAIRGQQLGVNFCSCADFATNQLGTCKHVEFTLARLGRRRGGKKAFSEGFQPPYSEIYVQYGMQRIVHFVPGADCPVELARLAGRYFDDEGKLNREAVGKFDRFLSKASNIDHDLRIYDDTLALVAQLRDAELRREVLARAFPRGNRSAAFKKLLKANLYDYQRDGALFAARAGRSLLADEMGLGKTIQALAMAEIMAQHFGVERVLIVCPTSLKHQWMREIERFTHRDAQEIGGLRAKRQEQFAADGFIKITNYDTVYRDLESINAWSPELVILDEAQRIKNWETRTAKSVKQIHSPYCLVLTGTPLENRLEELMSIVQFIDQHRLGPTHQFLDRHQERDAESGRVIGYRELDKVAQTLEPILIRRRKSEVLDQLPERLDKTIFTPMTPQQMDHHVENQESVARIVRKWRRFGFLTQSDQTFLMISLQNMRMSCDSTYLLDKQTDFSTKPDELAIMLDEVLEEPDTKVVIFSQWLRMHELLQRRFVNRHWDHVLFSGRVPTAKRKGLVDRFREDPLCRVFLSTDAGGVGLNLQRASVVVNVDMPWNPAVLEQRIGRAHRLGQTQPVRVVNYVAQGTIEHGMLSLLDFKKGLFSGVLDGGQQNVFLGKSRLGKFIETIELASSSIPETDRADNGEQEQPTKDPHLSLRETKPVAGDKSPQHAANPQADPLSGLIENGLVLISQLSQASQRGQASQGGRSLADTKDGSSLFKVLHDEESDESYLKIPIPKPEVIQQLLQALSTFAQNLR